MNPATRLELRLEFREAQNDRCKLNRFRGYALDLIADSVSERGDDDVHDPAFVALEQDEKHAYIAALAEDMGPELIKFAQAWFYTSAMTVDEWRIRQG